MTILQLDENISSARLLGLCSREGLATVQEFPTKWRCGIKDPELLMRLAQLDFALVTNDRKLPREHSRFIADRHPGIITVGLSRQSTKISPPSRTTIMEIMANFKKQYMAWHKVTWRNSIVEITEVGVSVSHVELGCCCKDCDLRFEDASFSNRLSDILRENENIGLLEN